MSITEVSELLKLLREPTGYTTSAPKSTSLFPTVPQPGLLLIKPQFTSGTALQHEQVQFWQGPGATGLTLAQLTIIQSAYDNQFGQLFATYAGTGSQYLGCYVQDFSSTSGLSVSASDTTAPTPSEGGLVPDNVAILVSWKTPQRYKGGHGRWYMPCVGTATLAPHNTISTTIQTNLGARITLLQNAMTAISGTAGGPYNFVIYRHRNGRTGTPQTVIPTGFTVQLELASQRRRLRKAAHH